jgi:hypothetical protein
VDKLFDALIGTHDPYAVGFILVLAGFILLCIIAGWLLFVLARLVARRFKPNHPDFETTTEENQDEP